MSSTQQYALVKLKAKYLLNCKGFLACTTWRLNHVARFFFWLKFIHFNVLFYLRSVYLKLVKF